MKKAKVFPERRALIKNVFEGLQKLGGSATNEEIRTYVINTLQLSDDIVDAIHLDNPMLGTELEYQLKWARTYLKAYGAIDNTQRGVWVVTSKYKGVQTINDAEVKEVYHSIQKKRSASKSVKAQKKEEGYQEELFEEPWRLELFDALCHMDAFAFERLTKFILREVGFESVEVTSKTRDKGIDGRGLLRIGLLSFNVVFQCKRYQGQVGSAEIRNFRGSLPAAVFEGIFITTGTFTNDAQKEALDESKPGKVVLVDGDDLIDIMVEHGIGVKQKIVYEVDKDFIVRQ